MPQLEQYIPQNMGSAPHLSLLRTPAEFSARSSGKLEPTCPYRIQRIGANIDCLAVVSTSEN